MLSQVESNKKYTDRLKKEGWKFISTFVPNDKIKKKILSYRLELTNEWKKKNG
jgi:hypothetical protein